MTDNKSKNNVSRRTFLASTAAASAGLAMAPNIVAGAGKLQELRVAMIGYGQQGRKLVHNALTIPHVRFMAVADIWEKKNLQRAKCLQHPEMKRRGHVGNLYVDYKEMLAKEKDLDAVIIATPDFCHAQQAIDCMEKGLHVYCEAPMAHTLEDARKMVQAAKRTGKLLQVGYQRRSNPRYLYCRQRIRERKALGQITTINGQWNMGKEQCELVQYPQKDKLTEKVLRKYGYADMQQFSNWKWYTSYSSGLVGQFGAHQLDVYQWFLDTMPSSVLADGGNDYYKDRDCIDHAMTVLEFPAKQGTVRAFTQFITSNGYKNGFVRFLGVDTAIEINQKRGHELIGITKPFDGDPDLMKAELKTYWLDGDVLSKDIKLQKMKVTEYHR